MIKVTPLGVNGAFTKYYHNNFVFELGDRKLLVDAGTTLRYSLYEAGFKETDITDIFITHLHSDHVGGLEEFAQKCKWIYNHKPNLWLDDELYMEIEYLLGYGLDTDGLCLFDYFNICNIGESQWFNNFKFFDDEGDEIFELSSINTDDKHCRNMKSRALHIKDLKQGKNVLFSGDIKNLKDSKLIEWIDSDTAAIFQDCSLIPNAVHATIEEVLYYYGRTYKNKIYAMHYQDDIDAREADKKYGIRFMVKGNYLEI
ncbi:MBL fold metallo-hydrolase [Priestia megaterium]